LLNHHSGHSWHGRLAFANIANFRSSIAGKPFDLKDHISDEQYLTIEKNHQHVLDVWPDLPHFLWVLRGYAIQVRGILFHFWIIIANPDFVACIVCAFFLDLQQNLSQVHWSFRTASIKLPFILACKQ